MPLNFNKLTHAYHTTTTSVITDGPAASKEILKSDFVNATRNHVVALHGEGASVYMEKLAPRDGVNFPTAVQEILATDPAIAKVVRLTDTLFVALTHVANSALTAHAMTLDGSTLTVGSAVTVNNADTDSVDICRISNTSYATAYRDEGGDDYLCARMGSVSGTTITQGAEKELTSAAITEDELSICQPRDGVLLVAYADGDDDVATIAAAFTTITVSDPGSVVELDAAAPTDISCCRIANGYVFVAYGDSGDSDKLHARVASVSAAAAIGTPGTEKKIVDLAATYLNAVHVEQNKVIIGYEDAGNDPNAVVCTVAAAGTTITAGTAVEFLAGTVTDVGIDMIDNTQGMIKWDDGTNGQIIRFSLSGTTITADAVVDNFVETASVGGGSKGLACTTDGKCVIVYEDADNDLGVLAGKYHEDKLFDIRSATASVSSSFAVVPVWGQEAAQ